MFLQVSGARILMSSEREAILLEREANKETEEKEKKEAEERKERRVTKTESWRAKKADERA